MVLKWSRGGDVLLRGGVNNVLPLAGFCPNSQNFHSDGAKIQTISESSKFSSYFSFFHPKYHFFQRKVLTLHHRYNN